MRFSLAIATLLAAPALQGADFNVESTLSYTLPVPNEAEVRSTFSALMDHQLDDHWHFVWGMEYERFDFSRNTPGLPGTLQAVGGHLDLEYRVGDDPVFMLELQPGWHSGANVDHGTYDIPVTLASGYPLAKGLDLAFGAYYARLSRYPFLPVGGLVWKINEKVEMDLVFPNTFIAWSMTKADTLSAFANVMGTGFQTDDPAGHREKVEYYQTRTGLQWEHEFAPGWSTTVQGGWSLDRTMDFYQVQTKGTELVPAPFVSLGFKARF